MRVSFAILAVLGLAACEPRVPESGAGVGFQDYGSYLNERTASATSAQGTTTPQTGFTPGGAAAAIDRASGTGTTTYTPPPTGSTATGATRPRGNAPAGIEETTAEMVHSNPGVSDEQDFQAVSARETIASDKARIERNRAQYQVDQPGSVPQRQNDSGPNIVQFALSTSHPPGTQMYNRSSLRMTSSTAACAKYGSPDLAQEAFLAAGGPEKDRKGLDPDGDGYACTWDPRPFRTALQ
jgi:hypothetical protein